MGWSKWKKYIGFAITALAIGGIALNQSIQSEKHREVESGRLYSFPQEHFSLKFPVTPEKSVTNAVDQNGQSAVMTAHTATNFGAVFLAFSYQYSGGSNPTLDEMLQNILASNPLNQVIMKDISFQGVPAKEYETRNEKGHYRGVIFLEGNEVFQIIYGESPTTDIDRQNYQSFLNSFQYIP